MFKKGQWIKNPENEAVYQVVLGLGDECCLMHTHDLCYGLKYAKGGPLWIVRRDEVDSDYVPLDDRARLLAQFGEQACSIYDHWIEGGLVEYTVQPAGYFKLLSAASEYDCPVDILVNLLTCESCTNWQCLVAEDPEEFVLRQP